MVLYGQSWDLPCPTLAGRTFICDMHLEPRLMAGQQVFLFFGPLYLLRRFLSPRAQLASHSIFITSGRPFTMRVFVRWRWLSVLSTSCCSIAGSLPSARSRLVSGY